MTGLGSALITGGSRRIGAAITETLHEAGYRVLIHFNSSAYEARDLAEELNRRRPDSAHCLQADLAESEAVSNLCQIILKDFNDLSLVVNNASVFKPTALAELDGSALNEHLLPNLLAPALLCSALAPTLIANRGAVVNITDVYARIPLSGYPAYTLSKAGLDMLTRQLAMDLAPHVRVNNVAPGAILWPETGDQHYEDPDSMPEGEALLQKIPLGRLGDPRDIAEAVLFLARDATYITGASLRVDGGQSV